MVHVYLHVLIDAYRAVWLLHRKYGTLADTPACTRSYTSTLYGTIASLCMLQVYVQLLYIEILKWSQIKLSLGPTQKGCTMTTSGVPYTTSQICHLLLYPSLVPGLSSHLSLQPAFETNTGLSTRFCKLREPLTSFLVARIVHRESLLFLHYINTRHVPHS